MRKDREEKNPELIKKITRRTNTDDREEPIFLVFFTLDKELPLIGA